MKFFKWAKDRKHSKWMFPVTLAVFLALLFSSFGYAALNTNLNISGDAYVRIDADIRVTDIRLVNNTNASETFQSNYTKDTITIGANLLDNTSSLTYEYTIVNKSNVDYLITNITELKNNPNITYTNEALKNTIIKAGTTQTFNITLKSNASNQEGTLTLQFEFNEDEVTPPVLKGGSNSWVATNQTISIATAGTATSGVKNYEYYVSDVKENPGDKVTGITNDSVVISEEGTHYVFYRTVSNTGKKSSWAYQITKIDKKTPVLAMMAAGNYEMSDGSTIISSALFGISGGQAKCVNETTGSTDNVVSFRNIKGFGKYQIKCTLTGNNGKTATLTKTYAMGGTLNASYGLSCKNELGDNQCTKNGTSWTVPSGCVQFGPYFLATKGCYKVTYSGSGFNKEHQFFSYQYSPRFDFKLLSLNITGTKVTYYINATENMTGKGIEFVLRNSNTTNAVVSSVKIESISTCPAS